MKEGEIRKVKFQCTHCGADNYVEFDCWIYAYAISSGGPKLCWYCDKWFKWYINWR